MAWTSSLAYCVLLLAFCPPSAHAKSLSADANQGTVVTCGGFNYDEFARYNVTDGFDISTKTWNSLGSLPSGGNGIAMAVLDGQIYAIGGVDDDGGRTDVLVYDETGGSWRHDSTLPMDIEEGAVAVTFDDSIYVLGGQADPHAALTFQADTKTWANGIFNDNMTMYYSGAAVFKKHIYVCGGYLLEPTDNCTIFNPSSGIWKQGPSLNQVRGGVTIIVLNNLIYAIGGGAGKNEVFNPSIGAWKSDIAAMSVDRHYAAIATDGKYIYAAGGNSDARLEGGTYYKTAEMYDPHANSWSKLPSMKQGRNSISAVFVPKKLNAKKMKNTSKFIQH